MAVKEDGAEVEYESDPEDALRPSAMRRREASDDEDGELSDGERRAVRRVDPRASDGESEGQGGAPADEDEEEFDAEEEEDLEEEAEGELEDEAELEEPGRGEGRDGAAPEESAIVAESGGDDQWVTGEPVESLGDNLVEEEEEEKKENKPYAVPTAGAFYMHDDRFRENGRGRRRRLPDARKLWESKDDRAWVHDRFEEMNLQDVRYAEERRTTKGRFRGRGNIRAWGTDHGHVRGNKLRPYDDNNNQNNRSRAYDDSNNQNRTPRSVRGRGPRRYEPLTKNISATQNKQYTKSHEPASSISAGRQSSQSSSMQSDPVLPRKHGFASNLNSASPPFYPSGSSNKEISVTQKRDTKNGFTSKTISSHMQMGESFSTSPSSSLLRAKAIVESVGHDKGYRDDYIRPVAGKSLASSQLQSSESSLSLSSPSQSHSRFQGRDINITGPISHQPITPVNQSTRGSAQTQTLIVQQKQVQTPVQAVLQISTQQMGQRLGSGTQSSSPPQAPSVNSSDGGEARSPPGGSRSSTPSVGKGKIVNQGGSGSGSFLYSGAAQILGATGAMGLSHGDQNFPATPALLPVMQFGGQHHGGLGFPAVGMALPGYVAQPQLGFGNSEMTWVPMLAGAAGALGASYCSPYMALDSSFYAHNSGQTSSSASSSRETGQANTSKSPQEPETVNDEYGQRQNKPRRYSEMNFGQ